MATISKLKVDLDNQKLIISATSSRNTDSEHHYRFTKIYIDVSNTFNCKNEPSTIATNSAITIKTIDETGAKVDYPKDTDLEDYEVSFSDILCTDDFDNELFFVWIEESVYNEEDIDNSVPIPQVFGVTLNVQQFYELLLNHISIKNECECDVDCSEVNFMLAWNGFNLSKTLQEYHQMIYYWKILHSVGSSTKSSCGCNK